MPVSSTTSARGFVADVSDVRGGKDRCNVFHRDQQTVGFNVVSEIACHGRGACERQGGELFRVVVGRLPIRKRDAERIGFRVEVRHIRRFSVYGDHFPARFQLFKGDHRPGPFLLPGSLQQGVRGCTSRMRDDLYPLLEERMRSRFKSGIVVDIGKPDVEMRMAILRSKAQNEGIKIDEGAISYIAERVDTNIRELEGAMINASLLAKVERSEVITLEIVSRAIKDTPPVQEDKSVTPQLIIAAVAESYAIRAQDILSSSRNREFSVPRQLAIYLTRELCRYSTTKVGEAFGRDHSTVMHACKKTEELLESSNEFKVRVELLRSRLTDRQ